MFIVFLFKVHIQTHIGWSIYIKCKHLEWNTSSLLQVGCDGKGQHRDDENILYVTLVLAAWADSIFWNHQGTQFKWMQFVVCAVFLARLIKQLLLTGLWEVDDSLSKAEVLEEVIERIKMLGMCWWSFYFQRSPTKERGTRAKQVVSKQSWEGMQFF